MPARDFLLRPFAHTPMLPHRPLSNTIEKLYSSRRVEREKYVLDAVVSATVESVLCFVRSFRTIGWMRDTNTGIHSTHTHTNKHNLRPRCHRTHDCCGIGQQRDARMKNCIKRIHTHTKTGMDGWMVGWLLVTCYNPRQ